VADPGWAPFLAVVAVLTFAVLGLARQSQSLLEEHAPDDGSDGDDVSGTQPSSDSTAGPEPEPAQAGDGEASPASERGGSDSIDDDSDGVDAARTTSNPVASGQTGPDAGADAPTDPQPNEVDEPHPTEPGPEFELTTGMLLANVAVTQGIVALVVVVAAWYFAIPAEALGADPTGNALFPAIGLGAAFGVVLWVGNELSTAVADAVGAAYDEAVRQLLAPDSAGGWAVLLGVVLPIIAVSEELLFRAALIGVPAAGYGVSPWLLAVVASAAFALGHGAQGRVGVVVTGALGFVLAAGYVVSGSLLLVIVAHYVINALEFLVHEGLGIDDVSVGRRVLDA
jgi:membrane protease YdiL (CAAX protease family)